MRRLLSLTLLLTAFFAAAAGLVAWVEAAKEVRVLCGNLAGTPGRPAPEDRVRAMWETATYGRLTRDGETLVADSRWNLGRSRCSMAVEGRQVTSATFSTRTPLNRVAAWTGATLLLLLTGFQVGLASGLPLGHLAWGGRHRRLPPALRVGSGVSAAVTAAGAGAHLVGAGIVASQPLYGVANLTLWALGLLFLLSTVGNALSGSPHERRIMTPVAFTLSLTCLVVALAG